MDKTITADRFREVFQKSLKITNRSLSVKTLLSERNLKRINYSPYYQRNYVWDNQKQTFFIESVILGTEIPPLVFFKAGATVEVIDGRQRFETLKKFKENDFSLSSKGLTILNNLSKFSFNKLPELYQRTFLDSNIRVFEFEVIDHPNLSDEILDMVKKEIFRRYNTGITPLSRAELDNAKYDTDEFTDYFKDKLNSDISFFESFNKCFFPSINYIEGNKNDIISQNLELIRKYRILHQFPIAKYAGSSERTMIMDILYDFTVNNCDDVYQEYQVFLKIINKVIDIHAAEELSIYSNRKIIFETLFWALSVLNIEGIDYEINNLDFKKYIDSNIDSYPLEFAHYYANTINRHITTAGYFSKKCNIDFQKYIRDGEFSAILKTKSQSAEAVEKSLDELANLRLHRPNPTSIDIDEIRHDIKSSNYLLRPSYQRQEKISLLKASSIIESILLGINLPPIFVFKRKNGVKEVVDGQQRLLSIIGFLGENYLDENGKVSYSKNNNFKLKGMKILDGIEGRNFSSLDSVYQDRILDFVVDIIVIDEMQNENFDPIDLFIRLNYKPYPIKPNSFEMWNSMVSPEVIQKVKDIAKGKNSNWFFLRELNVKVPDRMLNEELLITLSYMHFRGDAKEVIGFFSRQKTITCRVKDKQYLSDFLTGLSRVEVEKDEFIRSITKTEMLIDLLNDMLGGNTTKESFNDFLNINDVAIFKRTLQDFYVIWMVLIGSDQKLILSNKDEIIKDLRYLLKQRLNPDNNDIDEEYMERFMTDVDRISLKYSKK
ncbi:DUF262 domain-containing protein [Shewanella sp. FJAT-51649]|uniref:DUF262 domain-containing protein n=1 Tax=Shewanella sp. FJAT-51649 TaxID=2864210 RepID=UPI001C65D04C|nr:DUF262 domain-containing protein [Shewanella sp. FJAT-51649]QYJ70821.1 DUF262 domain-containing protein [Shewanella sp. FJAT-51649]